MVSDACRRRSMRVWSSKISLLMCFDRSWPVAIAQRFARLTPWWSRNRRGRSAAGEAAGPLLNREGRASAFRRSWRAGRAPSSKRAPAVVGLGGLDSSGMCDKRHLQPRGPPGRPGRCARARSSSTRRNSPSSRWPGCVSNGATSRCGRLPVSTLGSSICSIAAGGALDRAAVVERGETERLALRPRGGARCGDVLRCRGNA